MCLISSICSIIAFWIKDLFFFVVDFIVMNLHEECLLKYLINPLDLFYSTELLKHSNSLIEQKKDEIDFLAKKVGINYTGI